MHDARPIEIVAPTEELEALPNDLEAEHAIVLKGAGIRLVNTIDKMSDRKTMSEEKKLLQWARPRASPYAEGL